MSKIPWSAKVVKNNIVISMDIESLIIGSPGFDGFTITNKKIFIKELINTLLTEEEDGTTPIHRMFDNVIIETIDNGSEGIEEAK